MRPSYYLHNRRRNSGVSLVEYVLGLAILAIVLVGVGLFFLIQPRQLDPVFQFRAVSLAEALAEQVLAVKYDEKNKPEKQSRCSVNCTKAKKFGVDGSESQLSDFNDVDDFQLWCNNGESGATGAIDGEELATQLNLPETQLYRRFTVETCVELDASETFKQVAINISIDRGDTLSFILYRYNIR
ncbi:MAG: prepilin-type N-terminal cleavage/methylation domain-containing protein [Oceanospirillales bacterium]|nr:prepilin-type N-terminal cleavage/methylation domain-containing protein [Oceanospirillales bacterium]